MELKTHGYHKDLFSELAPEVLGDIFVHCLPPETEPISLKSGPLLLVQVCHRWREVAFGTPNLWQNIHVKRGWPGNLISILDLFLSKSGNLPLTITLGIYDYKQNEAVAKRVVNNLSRVVSLKGHISPFLAHAFFKYCQNIPGASRLIYTPLLKHLHITDFEVFPELSEGEHITYVQKYIRAPNLEELDFRSSRTILSIVSFSPESLKVLTGLNIPEVVDISLLCNSINLERLQLRLGPNDLDEDTVVNFSSSVYLPNLKHLEVSCSGAEFADIIRSLHCPAIEKLCVYQHLPFPHFVESLTKGQTPPLRSLLLSSGAETQYCQLSSFTRFKEVEELILHSFRYDMDETTIQTLMEKEGCKFRIFPRLTSITIQHIGFRSSQTDSILKVLRARCMTSGGTLSCAKFQGCYFYLYEDNEFYDCGEKVRAFQKEFEGKLRIDIVR